MSRQALLALTSHGNAPFLMAARFTRALGDFPVVVPWYYGQRQSGILFEEIPQIAKQVYLSKELGDLFKPLLLKPDRNRSFAQFGSWQADPTNPQNARVIENKLNTVLIDGITAESLSGEVRRFHHSDFLAAINSTLPVRVNLPHTIFFFTARMSRLYGTAPMGEIQPGTSAALKMLEPFARLWADVEETFDTAFVPRINAFSGQAEHPDDRMILTPPLAFKRKVSVNLEKPGILFVPSGTRTDLEKLLQTAVTIPAEYQKLVLDSGGSNPDFPVDQFTCVNAEVFGDSNLAGVVSRGGWGTIWECLVNQKPTAMVQTSFEEDPEMGHSQAALTALGLAETIEASIKLFLKPDVIRILTSNMRMEQEKDLELFGDLAGDGFAYMAEQTKTLWLN